MREAKRNKDNTIIELVRYRRFGDDFLTLEWVYGESKLPSPKPAVVPKPPPEPTPTEPIAGNGNPFSINNDWRRANKEMRARFLELRAFAESLGSDVRLDAFKTQFSFKRVSARREPVFCYLHLTVRDGAIVLDIASAPPGGNRKYNRELVRNQAEFEKAKPLLREAYERT